MRTARSDDWGMQKAPPHWQKGDAHASGALPTLKPFKEARQYVPSCFPFAEKRSRLMSPFSKDETRHERGCFHPDKPLLAVTSTACFVPFSQQ